MFFLRFIISSLLCVGALPLYALDRTMPTVYVEVDGGMSTYKSKLLASNDTTVNNRFRLGVNAGEEKVIGFMILMETAAIDFELVDSTLALTVQDTYARYRWGFLYGGLILSSMSLQSQVASVDALDISASGYGLNVGLLYEFHRNSLLYLDISSVSVSEVQNLLGDEAIDMGMRMDIDIGAQFQLTKELVKLLVGYRQRTFSVETTETFAEEQSTTYLGLGFDLYF